MFQIDNNLEVASNSVMNDRAGGPSWRHLGNGGPAHHVHMLLVAQTTCSRVLLVFEIFECIVKAVFDGLDVSRQAGASMRHNVPGFCLAVGLHFQLHQVEQGVRFAIPRKSHSPVSQ